MIAIISKEIEAKKHQENFLEKSVGILAKVHNT